MKPFVMRDTVFCQFKGCLFVQIGATAFGVQLRPGTDRSWGLELFTPWRWFALRPFHRLTWRKGA